MGGSGVRGASASGEILDFVCLDPRKVKHGIIQGLLGPLGRLSWWRLPPARVRSYAETAARAEAAQAAARRPAGAAVLARLQRRFYAWHYNGTRAWFEQHPDRIAVAWNGLNGLRRVFMDAAQDAGARTLFFELAPFKGRVTCDPVGVNQANSLPRTADFYLDWMRRSTVPEDAWRGYRATITQRTSAHAKPSGDDRDEAGGRYVFAPLQVPGDSQLRLFGGRFRTVPDFIDALVQAAAALPEGWHLKIKEHPTAETSFADRITGRNPRVVLDNRTDTFALVAGSEAVVTVNSSVGLEAMFFDKPVVACGDCFWAIPGIAATAPDTASLATVLARPDAQRFDPESRSAFLNYLLHDYYVSKTLTPVEAEKILRRLKRGNWP